MQFYNESGKRVSYDTSNRIGGEQYGNIFRVSDDVCLKVYKKGQVVDEQILKFIKILNLKRFYELYDFLYGRNHNFRGHTMKYYEPKELDILTMPIDYTLCSLNDLYGSFNTLTDNNVFINDTHTDNVIMNLDGITVIDVDLFTFNKIYNESKLRVSNNAALRYLFVEIYLEALKKYHSELFSLGYEEKVRDIFAPIVYGNIDSTYKKLSRCKYPIDYLKK